MRLTHCRSEARLLASAFRCALVVTPLWRARSTKRWCTIRDLQRGLQSQLVGTVDTTTGITPVGGTTGWSVAVWGVTKGAGVADTVVAVGWLGGGRDCADVTAAPLLPACTAIVQSRNS